MNDEITNIPKIRFKGYTEDWEQRKLGELAESFEYGLNASAKKFDGRNKYIRITDIDDISNTFNQSGVTSPDIDFTNADNYKLKKGDILFARTGASVGKTYMYRGSDGLVYYAGFLIRARIKSKISSEFIFQTTFTDSYNQFIKITSQRSGQPGINAEEYSNFKIMIPNYEEQNSIGRFFKKIDDTIALHQRELDLLRKTKQTYLQKMFPKAGEDRPEIRFAGFTEPWEQRKLKEITERVRGNDGRMDLPTLTISAGSGWLDQRERFSGNIAGKEQKNYTLLKKGQLSYNHGNSKLAKYGAVFELKTYNEALVPRVYHSFGTNELSNPNFIEYMFATKRPDKELAKLVSSGARMDGLLNINFDEFMGINVSIPSVGEQKKIGSFFEQLDDTIALHQRNLNVLKEMKKSLLQQMFV